MFQVDVKTLNKLGKELRHAQPAVYREIHRAVLAEARKMAEVAKQNASWSTRIPATIKASASGVTTARIRAGGGKDSPAPHAKPYEHAGRQGTFRHPVFADAEEPRKDWTWVDEPARPFLLPAIMSRMPAFREALGDALVHVIDHVTERV